MPYSGKHNIKARLGRTLQYLRRRRIGWKGRLLAVLLVVFVTGAAAVGGVIWYIARDLPDLQRLRDYQPSLATKVYGDDGQLIGQFFVERRTWVPLKRIPPALVQAIVAVEDARFYEHSGIDPRGILRAFWANVEHFRLKQGASTITQQLARSLFLTSEKSLMRKVREALLAFEIERVLSKDEIIELYLNKIYFGHGAYGVQAAAQTYFGRDVDQLGLGEAAFVAGIPRAPTDYSPYNNPERAKQRQGVVLKRMVDEKFITDEAYRQVYKQDMFFRKLATEVETAPHLLEYIRLHLAAKYGDDTVYKGGLSVHTSVNAVLQKAATDAIHQGLRDLDKRQGYRGPSGHRASEELPAAETEAPPELRVGDITEAVVLKLDDRVGVQVQAGSVRGQIRMDDMVWAAKRLNGPDLLKDAQVIANPKPSQILAPGDVIQVRVKRIEAGRKQVSFALEQEPVVEGALLAIDPRTGAIKALVGGLNFKRSEYNRAISARRQPGSAFKPIIYATAIEKGFTPATMLVDAPVVYVDTDQQTVWKPENYEAKFYGPISLREALIHSRNLATVKLLDRIGIKSAIETARRLGIVSPLTNDLSLALGSSGMGMMELVSAYGVFANEGIRVEPRVILSVDDSNGQGLEQYEPKATPVLSKETAYVMTSLLQDVIQRGTGVRARVLGKPLAGKTGTTNDYTDAWFIGYSPELVVGVWVGFDDRRSLGDREAGASAALPIWIEFMRQALEVVPDTTFPIPDNIVFANVDPSTGMLPADPAVDAASEIFVKGTEPTAPAPAVLRPTDFYRADELAN